MLRGERKQPRPVGGCSKIGTLERAAAPDPSCTALEQWHTRGFSLQSSGSSGHGRGLRLDRWETSEQD